MNSLSLHVTQEHLAPLTSIDYRLIGAYLRDNTSKERITMVKTEDELREALNATADEIAGMYGNPRTWHSWITYLLERLEEHALRRNAGDAENYKETLSALMDEIRNRLRTGGW